MTRGGERKSLDRQLERGIGRVLRAGVAASSLCLAAGLVLSVLGGAPLMAGRLLTAGLVILLATPPSRVVLSVVEYLRERDWLFAAITLVVVAELAASALAAIRGL